MLFLTMGEMRHEGLWSKWVGEARGMVPGDCMAAATCGRPPADRERLVEAHNSCLAGKPGERIPSRPVWGVLFKSRHQKPVKFGVANPPRSWCVRFVVGEGGGSEGEREGKGVREGGLNEPVIGVRAPEWLRLHW